MFFPLFPSHLICFFAFCCSVLLFACCLGICLFVVVLWSVLNNLTSFSIIFWFPLFFSFFITCHLLFFFAIAFIVYLNSCALKVVDDGNGKVSLQEWCCSAFCWDCDVSEKSGLSDHEFGSGKTKCYLYLLLFFSFVFCFSSYCLAGSGINNMLWSAVHERRQRKNGSGRGRVARWLVNAHRWYRACERARGGRLSLSPPFSFCFVVFHTCVICSLVLGDDVQM